MKVSAIIATRGRPVTALGTIQALQILASGQHEIEMVVACDEDDPADTAAFFAGYGDVVVDCAPRPAGVGHCWNRVAEKTDADLILILADDCVLMTPKWDQKAVEFFDQHPWPHAEVAIAALHDSNSPGEHTIFMLRPSWLKHCELFDWRYPFWFADTALAETYSYIAGQPMPFLPINVAVPSGVFNPRLRDMGLWWCHFASSRQERLQRAAIVRSNLGLPRPDNLAAILEQHQQRDVRAYKDSLLLIKAMPHRKPPDEKYVQAKYWALAYLHLHDGARHLTGEKTALEFALETMERE